MTWLGMARLGMTWLGMARRGSARQGKETKKKEVMMKNNIVAMNPEAEDRHTIGERSIYTQSIVDNMKETKPGDVVTYSVLTNLIGMGARSGDSGYGYVQSAIEIIKKEYAIVMENIRNVGYRHMTKEDVAKSSMDLYTKKLKAETRRTKKRLGTLTDYWDTLTPDSRIKAIAASTFVSMNQHMLKAKHMRKLEAAVKENHKIGFRQTFKLFE